MSSRGQRGLPRNRDRGRVHDVGGRGKMHDVGGCKMAATQYHTEGAWPQGRMCRVQIAPTVVMRVRQKKRAPAKVQLRCESEGGGCLLRSSRPELAR